MVPVFCIVLLVFGVYPETKSNSSTKTLVEVNFEYLLVGVVTLPKANSQSL